MPLCAVDSWDRAWIGNYIHVKYWHVLTRQNGRHFTDDILKCISVNGTYNILIRISLKFVSKGPINNILALFQMMAWRRSGDKSWSETMLTQFTDAYMRQLWQLSKVLFVSEHKTQYILIHAQFTHIGVFWHISKMPPYISYSQICVDTAIFCIAAIFVKYCYTTTYELIHVVRAAHR